MEYSPLTIETIAGWLIVVSVLTIVILIDKRRELAMHQTFRLTHTCHGDIYIWRFHRDQAEDVLRSFGRAASNKDLNFTWWDAAICSQELRRGLGDDSLGCDLEAEADGGLRRVAHKRRSKR